MKPSLRTASAVLACLGLLLAVGASRSSAANKPSAGASALTERAEGRGSPARPKVARGGVSRGEAPSLPAAKSRRDSAGEDGSSATAELPRSLQGTDVDGGLDVDSRGHFEPNARAIALFDYFLSATGEESEAALCDRIATYAEEHLDEPALGEALALLDRYIDYRTEGRSLRAGDARTALDRLRVVHDLRRKHFGDDADALFGDDEEAAELAIQRSLAARETEPSGDEARE